ncbi:MAG: MazG family protein [Lachnospiraceae bacterium]|nr:MazG family protein [Lachnospiraceae bacterium]
MNSLEELKKIVEQLRAEDGCPWDRVQTHHSLRPCLREETAELLAAIRIFEQTGNGGNMREELGDLLLQVVMHSVIAEEENLFSLEDVIADISRKMIHRHPHVFGEEKDSVNIPDYKTWEQLKQQEKQSQDWTTTPLKDIPEELPALTRAEKVFKKCRSIYQKEYFTEDAILTIEEGTKQLRENSDKKTVEEAVVKILTGVTQISSEYRIQTEQELSDEIERIISEYEA